MVTRDERVDAYIEKSADFAKPILNRIRSIVHTACPEVKETIKWSFPNYEYRGSILCNMASFKQHCALGFWLSSAMKDPDGILELEKRGAMGNLGQLKKVEDLPNETVLIKYIQHAMALIDAGVKQPKKPASDTPKTIEVPDYFVAALSQNPKAKEKFEAFPYSHKKEYLEWITEAKTEVTREKRITTALEWIAEGKGRNWKYER